jgi:hypothetical protein
MNSRSIERTGAHLPWSRKAASFLCLVLWAGTVEAQDAIRVRPGQYGLAPGGQVTLPIELVSSSPVTGFSFGVQHTTEQLTLAAVTRSAALDAALGAGGPDPDFFFVQSDAVGPAGARGFTVGAIIGPRDAARVIPAGTTHIFDASYNGTQTASGTAMVSLTASLGEPPVELVIDVMGGVAREFAASSQPVVISVPFIRGDADGNGSRNITDAVFMLRALFRGGPRGDCPATFNFDGSTGQGTPGVEDFVDVNLSDAIQLLNYIFRSGSRPAGPFPTCGQPDALLGPTMLCLRYDPCI